jgi:hypothetical protein
MQKKRSIHSPGSPSNLDGLKVGSNPYGRTPAELPTKPAPNSSEKKTPAPGRKTP